MKKLGYFTAGAITGVFSMTYFGLRSYGQSRGKTVKELVKERWDAGRELGDKLNQED